jgi:hypothetical protein
MHGRQGLQAGAPMNDNAEILFSDDVAGHIADSGASWVRINFRLGSRFKDWTETKSFGFSALSRYETIIASARKRQLKVLGLLCNEAWNTANVPSDWQINSAEAGQGDGDNAYIREFAERAAGLLVAQFAGQIDHWQIWNEPNGTPTWMYPSNFAWLLARSYVAARQSNAAGLTMVTGGVLSTHSQSSPTMNAAKAGADYLRATYRQGKALAGWEDIKRTFGSYPLDVVGQHLYIDQWWPTSQARVEQVVGFMQAASAEQEKATTKPIWVTEIGWATNNVNERIQAENLRTAYATLKALPYTPLAFWFFLLDEPLVGLWHGLVRSDGTPKPGWETLRQVNEIHIYPRPQLGSIVSRGLLAIGKVLAALHLRPLLKR